MTEHLRHLREEEFVDAMEGSLQPARQSHVDACAECQAGVEQLRETLRETRSVDMPEPSPLFWDHFSDRVRETTALEPVAAPWWQGWLGPVGIAAAVAVVILAVMLRPSPAPTPDSASDLAAIDIPPDDGSWGLVIGLASEFDAADVREVAKPLEGTADAMIAELNATQRQALAKLLKELKEEIGEQ